MRRAMASVRIALVDDDPVQRERLLAALQQVPGWHCLKAAGTAGEMLAWLAGHEADVLLVDLGLPDRPGLEVIQAARLLCPESLILVMTLFADEDHLLPALAAGASGYLLKGVDEAELCSAVQQLLSGGSPLSPQVARSLLRRWQGEQPDPALRGAHRPLTPREQDVLQRIARGFSYAEIGSQLGVSLTTVQTHVRGVYGKLGVHTKTEAVFEARQSGLLR